MKSVQVIEVSFEEVVAIAEGFIVGNKAAQPGPVVGFYAGELANLLGVSPFDVLDWTKDLAIRWWLEGKRFTNYADMLSTVRLLGNEQYVEIEFLRDDCDLPLRQALQLAE